MILIANYTRNLSQKPIQDFSFMFYKKCCFRVIANIYPHQEPCKYQDPDDSFTIVKLSDF